MIITKENCPARWARISEWLVEHRQEELNSLSEFDRDLYIRIYNADYEEDSIPFPLVKLLTADASGATFSVSPEDATWKAGHSIKVWDGTTPTTPVLSVYTPKTKIEYSGDPGTHILFVFTVEDKNGVSKPVTIDKVYAPAIPENLELSDAGIVTFNIVGGTASIEYKINDADPIIVVANSGYEVPGIEESDVVVVKVRASNPGGTSAWSDPVEETMA